jgi:hypothetical protein
MSVARGPYERLLAVAAVIGVAAGSASAARADEQADRGISLSAWAGGALDRSVLSANGQSVRPGALVAGVTGVGNIEHIAVGGAVDTRPDIPGAGRLSISALLGYQRQVGADRIQLLGEVGGRRFSDVGGDANARQLGADPWLPFVGVRLGTARTVPVHGFVEVGSWLFARFDLRRTTVTSEVGMGDAARTDYQVGGFMAGLGLEVGLRLESPHPWNQGTVED